MNRFILAGLIFISALVISNNTFAADTDVFAGILKKTDNLACSQPELLPSLYGQGLVIMEDDKRALLANRIKDYRHMIADFRDINCRVQRQILAGHIGSKVGYVLADEISSITSKSNDTDERQHSVCNYSFVKEGSSWKITLEHCSSLPDYSINPGDDALYYFHNPMY
jgi:hypothetical protein